MNSFIDFFFEWNSILRSGFFAMSLFFLRYTVRGVLLLDRSSGQILKNLESHSFFKVLIIPSFAIYAAIRPGREILQRGRPNTYLNESKFVQYTRGLEEGYGKYYYDELLISNRTITWMRLCMLSATYTFLFTIAGIEKFPEWSRYTSTLVGMVALIHIIVLLGGIFWAGYVFEKKMKSFQG